jgi:hypothetical protein
MIERALSGLDDEGKAVLCRHLQRQGYGAPVPALQALRDACEAEGDPIGLVFEGNVPLAQRRQVPYRIDTGSVCRVPGDASTSTLTAEHFPGIPRPEPDDGLVIFNYGFDAPEEVARAIREGDLRDRALDVQPIEPGRHEVFLRAPDFYRDQSEVTDEEVRAAMAGLEMTADPPQITITNFGFEVPDNVAELAAEAMRRRPFRSMIDACLGLPPSLEEADERLRRAIESIPPVVYARAPSLGQRERLTVRVPARVLTTIGDASVLPPNVVEACVLLIVAEVTRRPVSVVREAFRPGAESCPERFHGFDAREWALATTSDPATGDWLVSMTRMNEAETTADPSS